ncbi:MAG: HdeD family acid-resistance protein [Deltaproteobacteria bacterium]|nr:HdeD family acid-resistance protein [Deltaproteobacteria bacterium]
MKENSGWSIAIGIILIILGIFAIGSPLITGVAVAIMVGSFLLVGGIVQFVFAFKAGSWGAGLLNFIGGALSVVCGVLMIAHPLYGLTFLTLLLAAFFVVEGISKIIFSFQVRPAQNWGWILFSGVVALLLGGMIWYQWPLSGAWAVGLLVGIDILMSGWSIVAIGLAARSLQPAPQGGTA